MIANALRLQELDQLTEANRAMAAMALDLFVPDEPTENTEDGFIAAEAALDTTSEVDYSDMPDLIDISGRRT